MDKSDHYIRMQLTTSEKTPALDNYSDTTIQYLLKCGEQMIKTYMKDLQHFAQILVSEKK